MQKLALFFIIFAISAFGQVTYEFDNDDLQRILKIEKKIEEIQANKESTDTLKELKKQRNEAIEVFLDDLKSGETKLVDLQETSKKLLLLNETRDELQDKSSLEYKNLSLEIISLKMTQGLVNFVNHTTEIIEGFKDSSGFEKSLLDFKESITIDLNSYQNTLTLIEDKDHTSVLELRFLELYSECKSKQLVFDAIYKYAKNRIVEFQKSNRLIDFFDIKSLILFVDSRPEITEYSRATKSVLNVTIGQIIASIVVFLVIVAFKNIIIPITIATLERLLKNKEERDKQKSAGVKKSKLHLFLKNSLHRPVSYLIYVFATDLALRVLTINSNPETLKYFFDVFYMIIIVWMLFSLLNNAVSHYSNSFLKKYPNIRGEMVNFLVNLLKFIITTTALVILLNNMGFNVTGLVASLGIGGLAVALAAKDTLSNIFGSISIIMDNMFSQGDWIVTDKGEGTIVDIGMRTTKIRTFDNAMIFLPNSYLANTDIKNWNKRKIGRRIMMHIGVTYGSRMEDILQAVEDIREMLVNHKDIANPKNNYEYSEAVFDRIVVKEDQLGIKNTLLVYLDQYSSSSIDILIYCFSKTVNWDEWLSVKQDVMVKVSEILKANNLEFAFPSQSVYLKNEGGSPFEIGDRRVVD